MMLYLDTRYDVMRGQLFVYLLSGASSLCVFTLSHFFFLSFFFFFQLLLFLIYFIIIIIIIIIIFFGTGIREWQKYLIIGHRLRLVFCNCSYFSQMIFCQLSGGE